MATADALCPPSGASEKVIDGAEVNPEPSLFKNILVTRPLDTPTVACAVWPIPTRSIVVIYPSSFS